MIGNINLEVSTAQAVTVSAVSSKSIDLLARQDIGAERGLRMAVLMALAVLPAVSGTAVTFTDVNDLVGLAAHGLAIGTPVTFPSITTTTGITAGNIYYVSFSDNTAANNLVLAPTVEDAHAGTNIVALTTDGTGTMTVLSTVEFQIIATDDELLAVNPTVLGSSGPIDYRAPRTVLAANINTGTDIITATGHGLATGDPIVFGGAGTMPTIDGALAGSRTFFAIRLTSSTYQVAASHENAFAGVASDISVAGVNPINYQIRDNQLAAGGPPIFVDFNARHGGIGKRWLGARYVVNGTLQTGSFTTKFVTEAEQGLKKYPRAWEV